MTRDIIQTAPGLLEVLKTLNDAGHQAHLVGGAVRNALMQRPVKDYDIATSAHPDIVQSLFKAKGMTVHPTGIEHGTLTVICEDEPFEITTWRRDVATDGRRATIAFADRLEDDAFRRDFTFNSLYMDASGEITDPTGLGVSDAGARKVRFIGSAKERIREDALRILRYFRFCATMNAVVDTNSSDFTSCLDHGHLLDGLSRERVGMEMRNILNAEAGLDTLILMEESGILARILPNRDAALLGQALVTRISSLNAQEKSLGLSPNFSRRVAILQEAAPKDELCLSRNEVKAHNLLARAMLSDMQAGELGYRLGAQDGEDALCLAASLARHAAGSKDLDDLRSASHLSAPVVAADLMGHFKGPHLGQALRQAEALWISSGFQSEKSQILSQLGLSPKGSVA
jgi:poly(A) polymerase